MKHNELRRKTGNTWTANGTTVWETHHSGNRRIADCDNESIAYLIAAAPALLDIAEGALQEELLLHDYLVDASEDSEATELGNRHELQEIDVLSARIKNIRTVMAAANGDTK